MKYFKTFKDNPDVENEVTYWEALDTLLTSYKDNDITRYMLTVENNIPCMFSYIRVSEERN